MSCLTDCVLASGFLGASIYVMIRDKSVSYEKLYSSLSDEKKEAYKKIKKERLMIWVKASMIGVLVSLSFSKFGNQIFNLPEGSFNKSCINTLIFFGVQYLVYRLHPKTDWMLNHVENNEQAKLWLEKYKYMSNRWHFGMVLGIIGYFFLNLVLNTGYPKVPSELSYIKQLIKASN